MPLQACSSWVNRRGPSERSWTTSAVHFEPIRSDVAATAQELPSWTSIIRRSLIAAPVYSSVRIRLAVAGQLSLSFWGRARADDQYRHREDDRARDCREACALVGDSFPAPPASERQYGGHLQHERLRVTQRATTPDPRRKRPTEPVGLYDPAFEHESCGVAIVARLTGVPTHETVERAITALENLEHRGATGRRPADRRRRRDPDPDARRALPGDRRRRSAARPGSTASASASCRRTTPRAPPSSSSCSPTRSRRRANASSAGATSRSTWRTSATRPARSRRS